MEKYFKISLASFMVFVVCTVVSYMVLPMSIVLSNIIMFCALVALLVASVLFALIIYTWVRGVSTSQLQTERDEKQYQIDMFELVLKDINKTKLYYVDKACDALEKIASASGDGTFDKKDIMKAAVDFRERANIVRRHADILIEARKNGRTDGVKELIERYNADNLFKGFNDAVTNYLPESFHNSNYYNVDDFICGNYKALKEFC